jgi:hypothetical protein
VVPDDPGFSRPPLLDDVADEDPRVHSEEPHEAKERTVPTVSMWMLASHEH